MSQSIQSDFPLVLVTGVTGYLAGQVAAYLLATGFRVRGTVRSLRDASKLEPVRRLVGPRGNRIELCEANLSDPVGWAEAVRGCTYVQHVASPVPIDAVSDPEAEVVRPAVAGVTNVLQAAFAEPGLRRVVLVSSTAAIMEGPPLEAGHIFTAADWTDESHPSTTAYARSKTLAERAAWRLEGEYRRSVAAAGSSSMRPPVELVVINPGLIIGPAATPTQTSTTQLVLKLFSGAMPAIPDLRFAAVDTRDVANVALRAMLQPQAAGRRYLVIAEQLRLRDAAPLLRQTFSPLGYSVPSWPLPSWVLRCMATCDPAVAIVLPQLGAEPLFDSRDTLTTLGLPAWRPVGGSLVELAASMIATGAYPDKSPDKRFTSGAAGAGYRDAVKAVPAEELAALINLAAAARSVSTSRKPRE